MRARILLLLLALALCGAVVAGCGGDDEPSADDAATTEQVQTTDTATTDDTATTETTDADTTSTIDTTSIPTTAAEAVELCKDYADSATTLSDEVRDRIRSTCEAVGKGDEEAVEKAGREACREIAEQLPAGELRDRAVEQCNKS